MNDKFWKKMMILTVLTAFWIMFFVGFHAIDNAWNMKIFEYEYDVKLVDSAPFSIMVFSMDSLYSFGIVSSFIGILGLFATSLIMGRYL